MLLIAHKKTCTTRQLVFVINLANSALKFPSQQGKKYVGKNSDELWFPY